MSDLPEDRITPTGVFKDELTSETEVLLEQRRKLESGSYNSDKHRDLNKGISKPIRRDMRNRNTESIQHLIEKYCGPNIFKRATSYGRSQVNKLDKGI